MPMIYFFLIFSDFIETVDIILQEFMVYNEFIWSTKITKWLPR